MHNKEVAKLMTREEVFKRIWNWHNFLYRYTDDKIDDFRYVVLGYCESSRPDELNITSYDMQMLDKMIEVYEANNISKNEKGFLASRMHKISNKCDCRFENRKTKQEQLDFINSLSESQLKEVAEQIEMYDLARQLYKDGFR